ncbi:MAG: NAD(P)/FAD-dependent oxidoreductase [Ignavibacteria bacterium]|nr:NAD(P)/FAD-dependent oxidoreductase [Ignavibacteria bacterium]
MKKKVVIIGGGFGGLTAAKKLGKSDHEIILIDKTNHHLFQPLLYQVATAALSPADIAAPLRAILRNQRNTKVVMGEVTQIDINSKEVFMKESVIDYDYLIVSVGSQHSYFGKEDWEKYAPGLKTISDALSIRERVLMSFEKAERASTPAEVKKYTTFVVVGGGPTGVEIAGALAEIAKKTMLKDFRNIDPSKTKIILVEAGNYVLSSYDPTLSTKAKTSLEELGVIVLTNRKVNDINNEGVTIDDQLIETENIIWAAGNAIPNVVKSLGAATDRAGRVIVENDLSVPNNSEVFVIGDAALVLDENKIPLPGVCPVAIQQGNFVADIIRKEIPKEKRKAFKYFDKGSMATIGRARAIMQLGKIKISGFFAWVAWVFIHILYLIGFRNRYKVLAEWIWFYISRRNGIRLITNKNL